jgi:hypothetical protein
VFRASLTSDEKSNAHKILGSIASLKFSFRPWIPGQSTGDFSRARRFFYKGWVSLLHVSGCFHEHCRQKNEPFFPKYPIRWQPGSDSCTKPELWASKCSRQMIAWRQSLWDCEKCTPHKLQSSNWNQRCTVEDGIIQQFIYLNSLCWLNWWTSVPSWIAIAPTWLPPWLTMHFRFLCNTSQVQCRAESSENNLHQMPGFVVTMIVYILDLCIWFGQAFCSCSNTGFVFRFLNSWQNGW